MDYQRDFSEERLFGAILESYSDYDSFSFDYQLIEPSSSRGERLTKPYKIVRTEDFVWSGLSFTANVGGILSMTLEFSFILCLNLLVEATSKVSSV